MIENAGVPRDVIDTAWSETRAFFDLPAEVKGAGCTMAPDYPYGYAPMNNEKAGNAKDGGAYDTSDLKESFQICLSSAAAPAAALPTPRWPQGGPPTLAPALTAYYRAMEALAGELLRIFAAALRLEPDFFLGKARSHWCVLRTLNYPEQPPGAPPPNPGQLRIAAHSDYGTLTILRADDAPGGLQVLRADGSWSDVVIPEHAFCVNLGDLMQRWTNDAWRSTVHRVVNPPSNPGRPTRRQSAAFFHNLDREAEVDVIETCVTPDRPAKYGRINAFEHLMQRHALATGAAKAFAGAGKA